MSRFTLLLSLVLGALLGAGLAYAVTVARAPSETARAVLVVPTETHSTTFDPNASAQLASTYADLLQRDTALAERIGRRMEIEPSTFQRDFSARRVGEGSLLTVSYVADRAETADEVLRRVLRLLRSPAGGLSTIDADTLTVVSAPHRAAPRADGRVGSSSALLVRASSSPTEGDALAAGRLAANYVGLIPEDDAVLEAASRRARWDIDELRDSLRLTNDPNTSVIRVSVRGKDYASAKRAVEAIAAAVAGPRPVTDKITPGSVAIARSPTEEPTTSLGRTAALVIGGLLGFAFALAMASASARRNPRLRSADEVRELFGVPALGFADWTPQVARSLMARWRFSGATSVTLLSAAPRADGLTETLARSLGDAERRGDYGLGAAHVGFRSHADAWEPLTGPDVDPGMGVLVVLRGQRARPLLERIADYTARGGRVDWVLLARGKDAARAVQQDLELSAAEASREPYETVPPHSADRAR